MMRGISLMTSHEDSMGSTSDLIVGPGSAKHEFVKFVGVSCVDGLIRRHASHRHCLSPARARGAQAAVTSTLVRSTLSRSSSVTADEAFLYALGRAGGLCDCGDAEDDEASLGTEAAGWPFFGQFVAHDITADRSALQSHVDPTRLRNARSPQLNLECLYGDGPVGHPYLFQRTDPAKLLSGADGQDVLRNGEGTAIIGDPRNDSHVLMSQMHLAFVHAHNRFVDRVRSDRHTGVRRLRERGPRAAVALSNGGPTGVSPKARRRRSGAKPAGQRPQLLSSGARTLHSSGVR